MVEFSINPKSVEQESEELVERVLKMDFLNKLPAKLMQLITFYYDVDPKFQIMDFQTEIDGFFGKLRQLQSEMKSISKQQS